MFKDSVLTPPLPYSKLSPLEISSTPKLSKCITRFYIGVSKSTPDQCLSQDTVQFLPSNHWTYTLLCSPDIPKIVCLKLNSSSSPSNKLPLLTYFFPLYYYYSFSLPSSDITYMLVLYLGWPVKELNHQISPPNGPQTHFLPLHSH